MSISRITKTASESLKYLRQSGIILNRVMSSNTASTDSVIFDERNNKGIITLNRPKALNSLNLEMVRLIQPKLLSWENNKDLVIIKGVGEKSFCAGGDVRVLVEKGDVNLTANFFREEYTLNHTISTYKVPYIAIIDGITMGGGVGLSVHGKYRIATERTMVAMPETAIGLFTDVGGSHFLSRLEGKIGLYLGLTGFRLKGKDVLKAGIATHYCDSKMIPELEAALINTKDSSEIPSVLQKYCPEDNKTEFILKKNLKKINSIFNAPTIEGIIDNLEKDGSEWAVETLKLLKKMSPTSLKLTQRELEYGAKMTLPECLKMEFRMAVNSAIDSDFKEGVRALLIDKDQQPKWNPIKLEDVTEERIQYFFKAPPNIEELKLNDQIKSKM